MKKFLSDSLKFQWKTIVFIFVLIVIQTFFQMQVIDLFKDALTGVKNQNIGLLLKSGLNMLMYTILSMIFLYAVSFFSTKVASNAAYTLREKIFHILMNLPKKEIDKFKLSGLTTRSTRGMSSEQGFIVMIIEQLMLIPVTFVAIVYEISLIDGTFSIYFLVLVVIIISLLSWKIHSIIEIFFRAKKTYGKINLLSLSKISNIANKIQFNKQDYEVEFENACEDSYDKNVKYISSQYYLGPMLMWGLYVIVLITLGMVNSGYTIGFESDKVTDSLIIVVYIAYFITTLSVIPALIDRWPRAYASSVRLEEVLNLEDKVIKSENTNNHPEKIEIVERDIADDDMGIWAERKFILKKLTGILKEEKNKIIISMILILVSTLCMVYAPKVAGKTVDLLISNSNSSNDIAIYTNLALLLVLYSIGYLIKIPSKKIMPSTGEKVAYYLRMKLFDKLDIVGSDFIQENSKGLLFSRFNNDVMNIREFVSSRISEIYAQILMIVLVLVLIMTTKFRLSLIYFLIWPIFVISYYSCIYTSKEYYDSHQKHLSRLMSYFERALSNRDAFHEKEFKKINQIVIDNYVKSRNLSTLMVPVTTFLTNITNITVYIAGVYLLLCNEIQIGTLLTVIMYAQLLTNPIKKISTSMASIANSFSSIKRIFAVIDYQKDK